MGAQHEDGSSVCYELEHPYLVLQVFQHFFALVLLFLLFNLGLGASLVLRLELRLQNKEVFVEHFDHFGRIRPRDVELFFLVVKGVAELGEVDRQEHQVEEVEPDALGLSDVDTDCQPRGPPAETFLSAVPGNGKPFLTLLGVVLEGRREVLRRAAV